MAASIVGLADLASWASEDEQRLVELLLREGQEHLFAGWRTAADTEAKHAFFEQIRGLERGYPGGLAAYLKNARSLLASSAVGANPFEGMRPEVPSGTVLEYGSPEFVAAEDAGMRVFKDCAFVLVAGGLGERLGYTDIKLKLPVETTTGRSYIQLYVQQILAMQEMSNRLNSASEGSAPSVVPLAIMTSDDTHAATVAMLEAHAQFGMAPGQITILKQEKVAALLDNDAHIALEEGRPYVIDTKPHGHGDVHTLLASSGLAAAWAAAGRRYVVFFQDTNAVAFAVTQAAIGVAIGSDLEMNSITVPRKAKDAVGGIARLVRTDGSSLTVNVEYNQLEPLLKASGYPDGDVNDASGYSIFPGNVNQLVMKLGPYAAVLARTGGLVPEFVNPKYADAAKTRFKKPTRLECMMQEHPKVMPPGAAVGFTTFPDWTYSPVKNSVDEGRAKIALGAPGRTAAEGELEFYAAAGRQLAALGVPLPPPASALEVFGFALPSPPRVVLLPSFAPSFSALRARFPTPAAVSISARSSLVLEGDVTILALKLDGALTIRAAPGARVRIESLSIANAGDALVPLSAAEAATAEAATRIRGFRIETRDRAVLAYDAPGEHVVAEAS